MYDSTLMVFAPSAVIKAAKETIFVFDSSTSKSGYIEFFHNKKISRMISGIKTCSVLHCFDAYAIGFPLQLENNKPIWLIYSGDTRPCNAICNILGPSNIKKDFLYSVLIHEATFDDEKRDLALRKNHSTTKEAFEIALTMQVDVLILTHFSQRYPQKITEKENGSKKKINCYFYATDFMMIPLPVEVSLLQLQATHFSNILEVLLE